jgi:mannose-6-phosphate isomerase
LKALTLYPLRFDPISLPRLWGGETWLLSDRDAHASRVSDGPLQGTTLGQLLRQAPQQVLGEQQHRFQRFPLLLKFLDVRQALSVQVHPSDEYAGLLPGGDSGKTEAWVVLERGPAARIFAGLKDGASVTALRQAIAQGTVAERLASFAPNPGDVVYIPAGTVHSLSDVVVFEVQQNSDVTFRLYDWDHLDPVTGLRRPLQVEQAFACIDFSQGTIAPITPRTEQTQPVLRENLIQSDYFGVTRISGQNSFVVGAAHSARVLVCLSGAGHLEHAGASFAFRKGDTLLLPAAVGACSCLPHGGVSLLEITLPAG